MNILNRNIVMALTEIAEKYPDELNGRDPEKVQVLQMRNFSVTCVPTKPAILRVAAKFRSKRITDNGRGPLPARSIWDVIKQSKQIYSSRAERELFEDNQANGLEHQRLGGEL